MKKSSLPKIWIDWGRVFHDINLKNNGAIVILRFWWHTWNIYFGPGGQMMDWIFRFCQISIGPGKYMKLEKKELNTRSNLAGKLAVQPKSSPNLNSCSIKFFSILTLALTAADNWITGSSTVAHSWKMDVQHGYKSRLSSACWLTQKKKFSSMVRWGTRVCSIYLLFSMLGHGNLNPTYFCQEEIYTKSCI